MNKARLKIQKEYAVTYHQILREKIFNILGHECVKCGIKDKRVLQFDHINGGGTREIEVIFKHNTDRKLKHYINNPELAKNTLQVLCANCNWVKRYESNELTKRGKE